MPGSYLLNGKFYGEDQPSIHPDNRSFRYGDGLFETIRVIDGRIPLWDLHMDRLFRSLDILKFQLPRHFDGKTLLTQSQELCRKNKLPHARLRINISRGEGGILEPATAHPDCCIQTWPLDQAAPRFNENGLHLTTYTENRKATGPLANLKNNNYLLYALAAIHAREQKCNDALVLNHLGNIADTTIANICWVEKGQVFTTPPEDGAVNGVMLQWLRTQINIAYKNITPSSLATADEVFITNAVRGVQWVARIDDVSFQLPQTALRIYKEQILPVFS